MSDDDHSLGSDGGSVDTAAALRVDALNEKFVIDMDGDFDTPHKHTGSVNGSIGSGKKRLSLEAKRQEEIQRQAIVDALNQFILQAGNIYKGNKLSEIDVKRLREAASDAGICVEVVEALLKQMADKKAMMEYCTTSNDVVSRKIKADPHFSRVLDEKGRNDLDSIGLNVSNSIWRIFLHKIIKQFLKEKKLQLGDIMNNSAHTRKLYEDALRWDPDDANNNQDTSNVPRNYSELRKRVFISEADAKLARMEASESMTKFQQDKNLSVYDLVDGAAVQRRLDIPRPKPKTEGRRRTFVMPMLPNEDPAYDSREDDLSMAPCTIKSEAAHVRQRFESDETTDVDFFVEDDFSEAPWPTELKMSPSDGGKREAPPSSTSVSSQSYGFDSNIDSCTIEHRNPAQLTTAELSTGPQSPEIAIQPSKKTNLQPESCSPGRSSPQPREESDPILEIDKVQTTPSTSEPLRTPSPRKIRQATTPLSTPERLKVSDDVKRRIAMYEKSVYSPPPQKGSPQIVNSRSEQKVTQHGNILQARAMFERKDQQVPSNEEPNRKRSKKNIQNVLATWPQKEQGNNTTPSHKDDEIERTEAPNVKIAQNQGVQNVRAAWAQKEEGKSVISSENDAPSLRPDIMKVNRNQSVRDVRATWERKEQGNSTATLTKADEKQSVRKNPVKVTQNTKVQDVRATWAQKEQQNREDEKPKGGVIKVERNNTIQNVRATWAQKEQHNNVVASMKHLEIEKVEHDRVHVEQNKNIQNVRTTWTKKEGKNSNASSENNIENMAVESGSKKIEKNTKTTESLGATQDQRRVKETGNVTSSTRIKQSRSGNAILGDKTSNIQNVTQYGSKNSNIPNQNDLGATPAQVIDIHDAAFEGLRTPTFKSNEKVIGMTTTNGEGSDNVHLESEKERQSSHLSVSPPLKFIPDIELYSTDESECASEDKLSTETQDLTNHPVPTFSIHQRVESRKLVMQEVQMIDSEPDAVSSNDRTLLPSIDSSRRELGEDGKRNSNGKVTTSQNEETPSFSGFSKVGTNDLGEGNAVGMDGEFHDSLAFVNSSSEDSNGIPMPPIDFSSKMYSPEKEREERSGSIEIKVKGNVTPTSTKCSEITTNALTVTSTDNNRNWSVLVESEDTFDRQYQKYVQRERSERIKINISDREQNNIMVAPERSNVIDISKCAPDKTLSKINPQQVSREHKGRGGNTFEKFNLASEENTNSVEDSPFFLSENIEEKFKVYSPASDSAFFVTDQKPVTHSRNTSERAKTIMLTQKAVSDTSFVENTRDTDFESTQKALSDTSSEETLQLTRNQRRKGRSDYQDQEWAGFDVNFGNAESAVIVPLSLEGTLNSTSKQNQESDKFVVNFERSKEVEGNVNIPASRTLVTTSGASQSETKKRKIYRANSNRTKEALRDPMVLKERINLDSRSNHYQEWNMYDSSLEKSNQTERGSHIHPVLDLTTQSGNEGWGELETKFEKPKRVREDRYPPTGLALHNENSEWGDFETNFEKQTQTEKEDSHTSSVVDIPVQPENGGWSAFESKLEEPNQGRKDRRFPINLTSKSGIGEWGNFEEDSQIQQQSRNHGSVDGNAHLGSGEWSSFGAEFETLAQVKKDKHLPLGRTENSKNGGWGKLDATFEKTSQVEEQKLYVSSVIATKSEKIRRSMLDSKVGQPTKLNLTVKEVPLDLIAKSENRERDNFDTKFGRSKEVKGLVYRPVPFELTVDSQSHKATSKVPDTHSGDENKPKRSQPSNLVSVELHKSSPSTIDAEQYFKDALSDNIPSSNSSEVADRKNLSQMKSYSGTSDEEAYLKNLQNKRASPTPHEEVYFRNLLNNNSSSSSGSDETPDVGVFNSGNAAKDEIQSSQEHKNFEHRRKTVSQQMKQHKTKTEIEEHSETEENEKVSWAAFGSTFEDSTDRREQSPLELDEKIKTKIIERNGTDIQEMEPNYSSSLAKEATNEDMNRPRTSRRGGLNVGATDIHFMTQMSNSIEETSVDLVVTQNMFKEYLSQQDQRKIQEKSHNSPGKWSTKDTRLRKQPLNNLPNPYLDSQQDSRNQRNDRRSIFKLEKSTEADGNDKTATETPMLTESQSENLSSEDDNCMALDDSNSIRLHHRGLKEFLNARKDPSREPTNQEQVVPKNIEAGEIERKGSKESDHFAALNQFLATYQRQREKEESSLNEPRLEKSGKDGRKTELQDHCDEILGDIEKLSSTLTKMNVVETVTSEDEEDGNMFKNPSEISWPSEEVKSGREASDYNGNTGNTQAYKNTMHDVDDATMDYEMMSRSTPRCQNSAHDVDEATMDYEMISRSNPRGQATVCDVDEATKEYEMISSSHHRHQNMLYDVDEVTRDYETMSESHPRQAIDNHHMQGYIHSYGANGRDPDSTQHVQDENRRNYRRDPQPQSPAIRILDRPLLDLDDDADSLDAVELERQNTEYSMAQDPEPGARKLQAFGMEPPDPRPADPSPEGHRLSSATPRLDNTTEAPEGATKEEINLLNRFIDVASSDFGGQKLSPESETRVRAAALKIGLTEKFVDQLLDQTLNRAEKEDSDLQFVPAPEQQQPQPQHQHSQPILPPSILNQGNHYYPQNHYSGVPSSLNESGGDNDTYYTDEYSRTDSRRSRRNEYEDCNVWEGLGKGLAFLANMTARTCGVNYHRNDRERDRSYRDDGSVVSAISWEEERRGRSRRPREDTLLIDRSRRVTFDDNVEEQEYDTTNATENVGIVYDNAPPREKITQLV